MWSGKTVALLLAGACVITLCRADDAGWDSWDESEGGEADADAGDEESGTARVAPDASERCIDLMEAVKMAREDEQDVAAGDPDDADQGNQPAQPDPAAGHRLVLDAMMDVLGEGSECILAEDRALYFQEMGWRFSQIYDATGERGTDTQTDQFYSSAYTAAEEMPKEQQEAFRQTLSADYGSQLYKRAVKIEAGAGSRLGARSTYELALQALGSAYEGDARAFTDAAEILARLDRHDESAAVYANTLKLLEYLKQKPTIPTLRDYARVLAELGDCDAMESVSATMDEVCSQESAGENEARGIEIFDYAECRWLSLNHMAQCMAKDGAWADALANHDSMVDIMKDMYAGYQQSQVERGAITEEDLDNGIEDFEFLLLGGTEIWSDMLSLSYISKVLSKEIELAHAPAAPTGGAEACESPWYKATPQQQAAVDALELPRSPTGAVTTGAETGLAIPRLTASDVAKLSVADFQDHYLVHNRPVIFDYPAVKDWPAFTIWTNPKKLVEKHGSVVFETAAIPYPNYFGARAENKTLADFIATAIEQDADVAEQAKAAAEGAGDEPPPPNAVPTYIFAQLEAGNPMLEDVPEAGNPLPFFDPGPAGASLFGLPSQVRLGVSREDETPFSRPLELAFGPAGSGAQPHDHTAAWNVVLAGRKRWFIWPRYCQNTGYAGHYGMTVAEWAQQILPKQRGKACAPIEFEQGPGEVVFVPSSWPHAVFNVEPSIAISRQIGVVRDLGRAWYEPAE